MRIKLMHREAANRLHDARILSANLSRASDSNYLLELLAFELLLKATLLIHTHRFELTHNYPHLFGALPSEVQERLRVKAAEWSQKEIDASKLLSLYRDNFSRLRYPFEAYKNMTESEYVAYGNRWVEVGAPIDEAEFQYCPEELYGLIKALEEEVERYLIDSTFKCSSRTLQDPPAG